MKKTVCDFCGQVVREVDNRIFIATNSDYSSGVEMAQTGREFDVCGTCALVWLKRFTRMLALSGKRSGKYAEGEKLLESKPTQKETKGE